MAALVGKKLGMTQIYNDKEELVPVTVVAAGPCPVVQVRSQEDNGYSAVQVAFDEVPDRKVSKPVAGQFAKANVKPHRVLREFRVEDSAAFEVGQVLDVSQFEVGDMLRVSGQSKGKGFAGVVKRFGFKGLRKTHGTPDRVRHGGSIGQGTTPGKVWKGKKMPGHMGDERITIKGLPVVKIDTDRNLLFIKGGVPGGANGFLLIQKS